QILLTAVMLPVYARDPAVAIAWVKVGIAHRRAPEVNIALTIGGHGDSAFILGWPDTEYEVVIAAEGVRWRPIPIFDRDCRCHRRTKTRAIPGVAECDGKCLIVFCNVVVGDRNREAARRVARTDRERPYGFGVIATSRGCPVASGVVDRHIARGAVNPTYI